MYMQYLLFFKLTYAYDIIKVLSRLMSSVLSQGDLEKVITNDFQINKFF